MKTKLLFTVAVLALSQNTFAQQVPAAGGQMQQIPPAPVPQKAVPEIRMEQGAAPIIPAADDVKVVVKDIQVSGQTVYSEAQLLAVSGFKPGEESSLNGLRAMALKIADYYHKNGYFVAQAFLPAQDIKDGIVTISVIEGRYGEITLRNDSKLSDAQARSLLRGLNSGDLIAIGPLEERLLLLADVPGVVVKSTLVPGSSVGTSDLIVDVAPGKRVTGSVEADNAGNPYTGEYRVGATVNINNLTGHGDVASLRVMTSGSGMTYARASYQAQFGRATAGVAYSYMEYHLVHGFKPDFDFTPLRAHGTAEIASIYGSYPLIRSRNTSMYALINLEDRTYQDKVDLTSSVADKKIRALMLGLSGDHRDGFAGGGYSAYALTQTIGDLDLRTDAARTIDTATARTNGSYNKLGYYLMRLQSLPGPFSLYGAIRGQFASKNLDITEKMELGGMYAVRAYPEGEAYGDEGYVATLEARMRLPKPQSMPGQMHLIGFADHGSVRLNNNPWSAGENRRTLSGDGVGLTWEDYNNFSVTTYWAHKLGSEKATSAPDKSNRFWIRLVKYF